MGFNVFLFVIVQLGLEPWRRRRLVGGFEEKVREVIQEETLRSALIRLEHPPTVEPALELALEAEGAVEGAELAKAAEVVEKQDEINFSDAGVISQAVVDASISESEAQAVAVKQEAVAVKEKVNQLFSEQVISLRRRDLTAIVAESAVVGAVVTGVIAFILNR